ncbi:MAG: hypothetical protein HOJ48_19830 [Desulfobacula sp.]|nr:hypothetical protein [Desulfobacula sp.]MBT7261596.1 hypothetical protein [Desulfobacula sp.]
MQEIDIVGEIVFVNPAFHKMCGYENKESIGTPKEKDYSNHPGEKERPTTKKKNIESDES